MNLVFHEHCSLRYPKQRSTVSPFGRGRKRSNERIQVIPGLSGGASFTFFFFILFQIRDENDRKEDRDRIEDKREKNRETRNRRFPRLSFLHRLFCVSENAIARLCAVPFIIYTLRSHSL